MKTDDAVPARTPIPVVNANNLITPVPKKYIVTTTINVDTDVPIDLLIVCHILSSNIFAYKIFLFFSAITLSEFSLILSKIMIVSLILYHIIVNIAIMKTVSTWAVGLISIRSPYAPEGIRISNNIVTIVTDARILGDTTFLIAANENNM